jgi:hypothetical protein
MTTLRFLILATCYFALRTARFRLCSFIVAMILDAGAARHGGEGFQPYALPRFASLLQTSVVQLTAYI